MSVLENLRIRAVVAPMAGDHPHPSRWSPPMKREPSASSLPVT